MKVSIITVSFNSERTIEDTIKSVLNQEYSDIEYIIIDGNSNDKTLDIIKSYESEFKGKLKFISEPDNGIYDAMNKGISISSGVLIGILNSDDLYSNEHVIDNVVSEIVRKNSESLYTDLTIVDQFDSSKILRTCTYCDFEPGLFAKGWHPPHPTFFVKKDVYCKYGGFDLALKISADFEFMLRILEVYNVSTTYLPINTIIMRNGGLSTGSIRTIIRSQRECINSFHKHEFHIKLIPYFFGKYRRKLEQYNLRGFISDTFSKLTK